MEIHTPQGHFCQVANILHRASTPSPHCASSQCKPCDIVACPSTSKLLGAPGSRLRPPSLSSWFCGSTKESDGSVVNHRKPRVQTLVVSRYPAQDHVHDFVLLFLTQFGLHWPRSATGSIELSLLVSPVLGGPTRLGPFAPALHLHQQKLNCNLYLQYSAKSKSTPRCQSLITPRSDHPPVLGRSGPQFPPSWQHT
jgi:hypothetical protein